jgi:hypothetical protein
VIIGLLSAITLPEWRVLALIIGVASLLFAVTRRRREALAARAA